MAPKTPQGNKSPKAPGTGGPIPLTGIPAPASVLQRRSFMPTLSSATGLKSFQNMTPEQQSLLAEAIAIHSPGLIDPNRKRAESVGSDTTSSAGTEQKYTSSPSPQRQSPVPTAYSAEVAAANYSGATPPGVLASPLSYRLSQARRASNPRSSIGHESNIRATTTVYSTISPSLQSFTSATPSPAADSPSGLRSTRLSIGPGIGTGSASARSLVKQPQLQRPPSMGQTGLQQQQQQQQLQQINALTSPTIQSQSQNQFPVSLEGIELGDRVVVESMSLSGYLRFIGPTEFKTGIWAGIELDTPTGKNDGSVNGVQYFNCRPKCGIFVLANKIVKTELLIPFPSTPAVTGQPSSIQEDIRITSSPVNHAAQAAARISAGSRASKYIGVTASQLKQRSTMPQPANSRLSQQQSTSDLTSGSSSITRNTTSPQTISPTPTASVTKTNLGSRLSQPGSRASLLSLANKSTTLGRAGSTTSPPTSISGRPRTSPTPGRLASPRRLSSRASDHSDTSVNGSAPSTLSSNLLDQAALVQMAESPQDNNLAAQLQQLQSDFGEAVAENNMLKTEMSQTKTQLEMTRLLDKRESLSYEERTFLSKSLGRGGIDERLGQELEELHAMKAEWEKEKAAKDQEIKGITEKMTQAWLDAARSQKERTALLQEKTELEEKLRELETNGVSTNSKTDSEAAIEKEEQQALVASLQKDLEEAEHRIAFLNQRAVEDEARLDAVDETLRTAQADYAEQIALLERERDDLQTRLDDLELVLKVTTEALQSKLEAALRDANHSEELLHEVQARLDHELELRRTRESESETRVKEVEVELQETQSLLAKSEKLVKGLEEKTKEYELSIVKREQEIADLKHELEDLADMVQSEEVDRMRRMWENEKKRLEEAVADDITVITDLRSDIQALELNESELLTKIVSLEATIAILRTEKTDLESEVSQLKAKSTEAQEKFNKDIADLQAKVIESEKAIELHEAETKGKIEDLEAIASTVETWREQCEAMQLEIVQKTAKSEDVNFELVETQTQRDLFKQEAEAAKKELAEKTSQLTDIEKTLEENKSLQGDKTQLLQKISELESALALSASTPVKTPSTTETDAKVTESSEREAQLEEEVAHLKQMVHDLTRENVQVASVNKKLMTEHGNLMEAHRHVETECLKLMDEVERLHTESLAAVSLASASDVSALMENAEPKVITPLKEGAENSTPPSSQSQSVIRLESLLKEKQALLDRLTQTHAIEMRELRQRLVDLDQAKAYEVAQLNKELTDLESLIESKIFHEADLEEEVQQKQKQIDRLQYEVSDLKSQLSHANMALMGANGSTTTGVYGGRSTQPMQSSNLRGEYRTSTASEGGSSLSQKTHSSTSSSVASQNDNKPKQAGQGKDDVPFCEICEVEGHDIISCSAVFGAAGGSSGEKTVTTPQHAQNGTTTFSDVGDDRPYCENCEEYGLHYTDECPNESLTY
ncbi:hypothetical protein BX616_004523 [Lobosporangium transversale]|nr:hypothetical protein BX616_004523 [Lobosporangium transversale]